MEKGIWPNPNWTQRYMIQQRARSASSQPENKDTVQIDPLAPMKLAYFHRYTELVGQPDALPESSQINAEVYNGISQLVENAAKTTLEYYSSMEEYLIQRLPSAYHHDARQYLNKMTSYIGRSETKVIEATILFFVENDSVISWPGGRYIRRLIPTQRERALNQVVKNAKRDADQVTREFKEELRRRYR